MGRIVVPLTGSPPDGDLSGVLLDGLVTGDVVPAPATEPFTGHHPKIVLLRVRIEVDLLDKNETFIETLSNAVVAGQVDCDADNDITRSLAITFADPDRSLVLEPDSNELFADKFLAVRYMVRVDPLRAWVAVPVFYGPISHYERDGAEVEVEAVGKEALMLPPRHFTVPDPGQGTSLKNFLQHHAHEMGERKFRLHDAGRARISKTESADAAKATKEEGGLWTYMKSVAASNDLQLYYGPDGYLTIREDQPDRITWTFHDGPGGTVLSEPHVSYDMSDLRNEVRVDVANDTDKHKRGYSFVTSLKAEHPFSAQSLAWNGVPRRLRETIKYDHFVERSRAERVADKRLKRLSRGVNEVSFDSLVIPHLEIGDTISLDTRSTRTEGSHEFTLKQFTIPLTPGESMSVGYTKPFSPGRYRSKQSRIRRKVWTKKERKTLKADRKN